MVETRSKPLVFYAFFTAARQGKTGLTVTMDLYRGATAVVTGAAATEIGGGLYRYTLSSSSTATAECYAAVFKTSDVTVDARHVPSLWVVGPAWAQAAASAVGYGDGDTSVDHNTGGADNLRYVAAGVGVDQAAVRAPALPRRRADLHRHVQQTGRVRGEHKRRGGVVSPRNVDPVQAPPAFPEP